MRAVYGDEPSSLSPMKVLLPFFRGNMRNFFRRMLYTYFVRNFSAASLELLLSVPLILIGLVYGMAHWFAGMETGVQSAPGVVMAAALPLIIGTQLLLSWLNYDVAVQPTQPIHVSLEKAREG